MRTFQVVQSSGSIRVQRAGVIAAAVLGACTLAACSSAPHPRDKQTLSMTTTSAPVTGRSTFHMPTEIPGHPVVMVPYSITSEQGWFDAKDQYADPSARSSRRSYVQVEVDQRGTDRVRWHNVVFRNLMTDAEHALLDTRGVISGFSMLQERPAAGARVSTQELPVIGLLFTVTMRDTNRNGVLDAGDLRSLILTGPTGENPRVITPEGSVMTNVQFYAPSRKLLIELRTDTNDDGIVNYDDEPSQYICDVPGGTARPLISDQTAARVRSVLK